MSEEQAIVKTQLTLNYLSRAEAELDMGGLMQSSSVLNQRQPVPSQWGLKVHVTSCDLEQLGPVTRVTAEASIEGPSKEKAEKWIAEFNKVNGMHKSGHVSQDEDLNLAREQARVKKEQYEAGQADN